MVISLNLIEEYSFGRIKIGGRVYTRDVIIFPDKVYPNWWRKEGHSLCVEDLEIVLKRKPRVLVIGTGYYGVMRIPSDVVNYLERQGINVIVKDTRRAVEVYNELVGKGEDVAAALHLTC